MSQLVKTKRQTNFKDFKSFGAFKGFKKTLYSTRSCINWAFFGTRGPLKLSFHSPKKPNLHTNSLNKLLLRLCPNKHEKRYSMFVRCQFLGIQISASYLKSHLTALLI
jgi:hypothetical protein